jgi:hypothetical protein
MKLLVTALGKPPARERSMLTWDETGATRGP